MRVDTSLRRVTGTIPVAPADSEGGLAADGRAVWMPTAAGVRLARIDPGTNQLTASIHLPAGSMVAATGFDSVWVSSYATNVVTRVNAIDNAVTATIPVGPRPRFLVAGFGAVWVLNQGDGTVTRIDPRTNQVAATIELEVPGGGGDIAVGLGKVWATSLGKPLSIIDPANNRVVAQYVGTGGDALRVGLGSVWICSFFLQELWRVDLNSN